jgi:hypothetical protein
MQEQTLHLQKKLAKHVRQGTKASQSFETDGDMHRYLVTRSVEQIKYEMNQEKNMYTERKNGLIAALSGNVMAVLATYILNDKVKHGALCVRWLDAYKQINALWDERLAGNDQDNEQVYNAFLDKVKGVWDALYQDENNLDPMLIGNIAEQLNILPPVEDDTPTQKADNSTIVEFYQWWIGGAEDAYLSPDAGANPEIINTIFGGENRQGLGKFFSALTAIHSGDDAYLPQRAKLFACLKEVMDYRGGYIVDLQSFAWSASLLERKFDDPRYQVYLECFSHFFKQDWLNETRASGKNPAEIKKISRLLMMIMKIVTRQDITDSNPDQEALLTFIRNISEVMREPECWDTFDDAAARRIESIFAADKDVTALLTLNTNKPELRSLIGSINAFNKTDSGPSRRESLVVYLKNERGALAENPGVIRHVFELSLAGLQTPEQIQALPAPNCLSRVEKHKIHTMFWHFLSQRSPVTAGSSKKIISFLSNYSKEEPRVLVQELDSLPPHVSLDYIYGNLAKQSALNACKNRLAVIRAAGESWCKFMLDKQLIESTSIFMHPERGVMQNYDHFLRCFNGMSPERNQACFTTLNEYPLIDLPPLLKFAYLYLTNDCSLLY